MRSRRRRDATGALGGGLVGIGGWLFADLLLALGIIFLVSIGIFAIPHPIKGPAGPSPSASPPTPAPVPSVCTKSIATSARAAKYDPGPGHARPTNDQLRQAFAAPSGEEEGLVQTKVTDTNIDAAYQDAQWVNEQLRSGVLPGVITANTHFDDLGWQDPRGDTWLVEWTIYPYVLHCGTPGQ